MRNSPKQDLHSLSPSDFVFGQPVRLPGEFFEVNNVTQSPTHEYVSKFSKYISRLAYCAPRTANREYHVDAALFSPSCTHVYIRIDSHRSYLAPFYRGPYRVISKHAKYFSVDFRGHSDTVSIDRLKAAQFSFASLNYEVASSSTASDGHDKPFCIKAITIIDNFKKALGDTDKSQFLKAISIIDKLSPINFSDKCCSKFSMSLMKFFFL